MNERNRFFIEFESKEGPREFEVTEKQFLSYASALGHGALSRDWSVVTGFSKGPIRGRVSTHA